MVRTKRGLTLFVWHFSQNYIACKQIINIAYSTLNVVCCLLFIAHVFLSGCGCGSHCGIVAFVVVAAVVYTC